MFTSQSPEGLREIDWLTEEAMLLAFKRKVKGQESQNTRLLKAGKGKEQILPLEPPRVSPANSLILACEIHFRLLTSRTVRKGTCVVLSH